MPCVRQSRLEKTLYRGAVVGALSLACLTPAAAAPETRVQAEGFWELNFTTDTSGLSADDAVFLGGFGRQPYAISRSGGITTDGSSTRFSGTASAEAARPFGLGVSYLDGTVYWTNTTPEPLSLGLNFDYGISGDVAVNEKLAYALGNFYLFIVDEQQDFVQDLVDVTELLVFNAPDTGSGGIQEAVIFSDTDPNAAFPAVQLSAGHALGASGLIAAVAVPAPGTLLLLLGGAIGWAWRGSGRQRLMAPAPTAGPDGRP